MRTILSSCRSLLSELRLAPQDWVHVLPMVKTALNESPLIRLGKFRTSGKYRSPLQVMTGLKPTIPNNLFGSSSKVKFKRSRAEQIMYIDKLQTVFCEMHKEVKQRSDKNRQVQIQAHNKKTNIFEPSFSLGDFVLIRSARSLQWKGHKLQARWIGPQRIVGVLSNNVYDVSSLVFGKTEHVHASRITLYLSKLQDCKVSEELVEHAEYSESTFEMVEDLMDIGEDNDGIHIRVKWAGLPDEKDWTWNAVEDLYVDVPDNVLEFLGASKKSKLLSKARKTLHL